jgi:hypothetical protein
MTTEKKTYNFKNTGEKELNDVVYPGPSFELLYHSYTFTITPKTSFWRFGIRLSTNKVVEFNQAGRYINAQYPDLQIVVGDRPNGQWINPNKIELGNYHYYKGYEKENPFDVCHTYVKLAQVTLQLTYNPEDYSFTISYAADGCPGFEKKLLVYDYRYFKVFAWADFIDFDLDCTFSITDLRYLALPTIPLTNFDIKWLNIIYHKFRTSSETSSEFNIENLWNEKEFPKDYNPKGINPLLLENGTRITLYGIYHLDPLSSIFEDFDKIIIAIRKILAEGKIPEYISSKQIGELLPELANENILLVFKQISSLRNFCRGTSIQPDGTTSLQINDPEILHNYRTYPGLQSFLDNFLQRLDAIKNQPDRELFEPFAVRDLNPTIGRTPLIRTRTINFKPVMGVQEIANFTAEIVEGLQAEKGQMIGVFARWGRGKTFLLNQLYGFLKAKKKEKAKEAIDYFRVDFQAWKYQETPASWAHLYEVLADKYLGNKRRFWTYCLRLIRLNFNRNKIGPLLSFMIAALTTITLPILSSSYFKDKGLYWLGITPAFLTIALTILKQLKKPLSTKATDLAKKYTVRLSFKSTLGIQAEIQGELVTLISTWISRKHLTSNKILLFVEDLDRCSEDKIIENIDALRLMLDNEEIAKRLIIVTAIDERLLKNAIRLKYEKLYTGSAVKFPMNELISEYLDKLFVSAIKLSELTNNQKDEFVDVLFEKNLSNQNNQPPASQQPITTDSNVQDPLLHHKDNRNPTYSQTNALTGDSLQEFPSTEDRSTALSNKSTAQPHTPTESSTSIPIEGFTAVEMQYFKRAIENWQTATPRSITIFYYRYLLCKNLLIAQYQKLRKHSIWQDEFTIKGLMAAILEFSSLHDPSAIQVKRKELLQQQPAPREIPIARDHVKIDRYDYLYMLEILEIVISY